MAVKTFCAQLLCAAIVAVPAVSPADRGKHKGKEHHGTQQHCPPGLAKKGSCLPPGQLKKRYVVGHSLPHGVVYVPEPDYGRYELPPPPHGHVYGYVDGDLLLIAEATKRVVDAIVAVEAAARAITH